MTDTRSNPGGRNETQEAPAMSNPVEQKKAHLLLKWGSIKGWDGMNADQVAILQRWHEGGVSMSAMMQRDSDAQKQAICDLIDTMEDGQIQSDWSGESMTRDEAKKYVLGYRR